MGNGSEEFQRLTRELRLRMRDRGVVGSVLGYALGWNCPGGDPAYEASLARWFQLWNRLGRPSCEPGP